MPTSRIHPSNIIYTAICLAGVAAFYLVGIHPNARALDQVDENIADLNHKVESQALLYPVYQRLIRDVQKTMPEKLPLPERDKIARSELGRINEIFARMAKAHDVVFENAIPDASSYLDESGSVSLDVNFNGDFFNFQNLVFDICRMPFLDTIEQMRIETDKTKKRLRIKLVLAKA
jgi:hypothetical protein